MNFWKLINKVDEVTSVLKNDLFDSFTDFDDIFRVELILLVHFLVYLQYFIPSIENNHIFFIVQNCISHIERNVK